MVLGFKRAKNKDIHRHNSQAMEVFVIQQVERNQAVMGP